MRGRGADRAPPTRAGGPPGRAVTRPVGPVCAALMGLLALPAAADPAFGYWLTENRRSIVEIAPCADAAATACGRIVWSREPRDADGRLKRDRQNPDPARRDDPICGLTLLTGLAPDGPGRWQGGRIYNPREGKRYSVRIEADTAAAERLEVRGYLGISLFGRSQTWTRETGPREGCPAG